VRCSGTRQDKNETKLNDDKNWEDGAANWPMLQNARCGKVIRAAGSMMFSVISSHPEETWHIGEVLGSYLGPGDIVCLYGDLGSGKTNLAYGIARGLNVREQYITSPTFIFVNEYHGRTPLFHIDLYRLAEPEELENIGFREYLTTDGVTVIEWAEKAEYELPQERLSIYLAVIGEESREIGFLAEGERYEQLMQLMKKSLERTNQ